MIKCSWCNQRITLGQKRKKHMDGKLYHIDCLYNKVQEAYRKRKK